VSLLLIVSAFIALICFENVLGSTIKKRVSMQSIGIGNRFGAGYNVNQSKML